MTVPGPLLPTQLDAGTGQERGLLPLGRRAPDLLPLGVRLPLTIEPARVVLAHQHSPACVVHQHRGVGGVGGPLDTARLISSRSAVLLRVIVRPSGGAGCRPH